MDGGVQVSDGEHLCKAGQQIGVVVRTSQVCLGWRHWCGWGGLFRGDGKYLYLDWGGSYTSVYFCQNFKPYSSNVCILLFVNYISVNLGKTEVENYQKSKQKESI